MKCLWCGEEVDRAQPILVLLSKPKSVFASIVKSLDGIKKSSDLPRVRTTDDESRVCPIVKMVSRKRSSR